MSKVSKLVKEITKAKKDFVERVGKLVPSLAEDLFEKDPNLTSIGIPGYTPGFNDGDPCTHSWSTYLDSVFFDFEDSEEDAMQGDEYDEFDTNPLEILCRKKAGQSWITPGTELQEFLDNWDSLGDELEDIYGTNVTVTIHRNGDVTTEGYDCGH